MSDPMVIDKSSPRSSHEESSTESSCFSGYISKDKYVENISIGDYIIIKELGSGSTAKVVLAFDRDTEKRVAIKIIKRKACPLPESPDSKSDSSKESVKDGFNDERIYREVVISSLLDHPHITKLLDFLYSELHFFLIFEYVKGKQLFDVILKQTRINEEKARKYFRQIVSAVEYIHKNSIVHRDLKIENIIIDMNDNIKVLDFGLSNFYDNKMFLKTSCGSLYFAAPELLLGQSYMGPEIDMWSLGIILYVMLCGKVPFDDESARELQNKIKTAKYSFNVPISKDAEKLITSMITVDPSERITLEKLMKSKWINIGYPDSLESYAGKRFPLTRLNEECIKALESALSFQFTNIREELENFLKMNKECYESIDSLYWSKNPIISLYYLLIENISSYSRMHSEVLRFDNDVDDMAEVMHRFVRFVFFNNTSRRPSKYFFRGVFQESSTESSSTVNLTQNEFPIIQKSYVKGLFQGIRVKHIGSHNAFKKIILDVFKRHSIVFEADEKGYFCSLTGDQSECYFKVTLFYNVLLREYYLVLKCLNSKKESFKKAYENISESLKYR